LIEKWKKEGHDTEMEELDAFFKRTGYPKTPRYYIIKWLTDR
jgi:alpha-amylase